MEWQREQRLRRLGGAVAAGMGARVKRARPRMRALQVAPGGRIRWRDAAAPGPPPPDGATVHPLAAATCDLDCPLALGATQFPLPLHLGHECVAEVQAIGERVRTVKPGDRVIVPFQINCGACAACVAGRTGSCETVPPVSMFGFGVTGGHWGGAFSDELAVPFADAMLVPLPDGVDPVAAASLADNICDAYRHFAPFLPALLLEDPDAEILILLSTKSRSLFSVSAPLYGCLIARALGARNISLADVRPRVRGYAEALGINTLHPRELRRRPKAKLVVDSSVTDLGLALACTAPDGVCTSVAALHRRARIPALEMYIRNTTLHIARTHARTLIPQALELILDGRLRPGEVPTVVAPLDDAPSALREHFLAGGPKTILTSY